jgi:hypothetical protein
VVISKQNLSPAHTITPRSKSVLSICA